MSTLALLAPRRVRAPRASWRQARLRRASSSLAAALCLWNLTISGYSNEYYAAAARAGSRELEGVVLRRDRPRQLHHRRQAAALAVADGPLGARARLLVASACCCRRRCARSRAVGAAVRDRPARRRRRGGPDRRRCALALTPITIAIARVNNPDALLVLLLVASRATSRSAALESGRTQAPRVGGRGRRPGVHDQDAPGLDGRARARRGVPGGRAAARCSSRVRQLAVAGAVMVAVSAAWPVAVTLWPGSKPYIGGSTDGSVWDLILGYNGFGRIFGEGGGMGGGGGADASAAPPACGGMFNAQVGGQIAWLLPLAGGRAGRRAVADPPRAADRPARAPASCSSASGRSSTSRCSARQQGIFHPYYVSALAPAVAALAGMGVVTCGAGRGAPGPGSALLAATIAGTAWLAVDLLARTAGLRARGCAWRSRSPRRRGRSARRAARRRAAGRARRGRGERRVRARRRPGVLRASPTSATRSTATTCWPGRRASAQGGFGGGGGGGGRRRRPAGGAAAERRAARGGGQPPSGAGQAGGPPCGGGGFGGGALGLRRHARLPRSTRARRSTSSPPPARRRPRRSSSRPARRSSRSAASAARTTRRPSPSSRRWSNPAS